MSTQKLTPSQIDMVMAMIDGELQSQEDSDHTLREVSSNDILGNLRRDLEEFAATEYGIELIHYRDPDAGCEHALFIDGEKVEDFVYVSMDAGAGWKRMEWNDHVAQSLEDLSPAARGLASGWFESASESQYIEDPV